jgi:hypothetical protein
MIGVLKRRIVRWSITISIVFLLFGTSLAQEINSDRKEKDSPNEQSRGTYIFNPIDDSYVGWPDDINGNLPLIGLRNGSSNDYWLCAGCIKFDISGIPSNVSIESASLSLYYYDYDYTNPAGHPLALHRFNSDWNEETISRNFMPTWSSQISTQTTLPSSTGHWLTWDVTSDVEDFISGALPNYGWIIKDEYYWSGANIPTSYLYSKEYGSLIPYLQIELTDNNTSPTVPQISGPAEGLPNYLYNYSFISNDPELDSIYYWIEWGDGDTTGWLGPYASGQSLTTSHTWENPGTYTIQGKAKDMYEAESNWGTYLVTMINNPPETPEITGPTNGTNGHSCYFTIDSIDPDEDQLYYLIEWGDGNTDDWNGPYDSGQSVIFSHNWDTPGVYIIRVQSKDDYEAESGWGTFVINIGSNPPQTPQITGAVNGTPGDSYDYTFITSDEDGNQFYYWIDWGDGQTNQWIGPYSSGQVVTLPHTWSEKGTYVIQAKAKDTYGAVSGWGTFTVTMPFSKNSIQLTFLEWLFEQYPNIFPILRHIFGY